jgi:hypothetical protein
MTAARTPVPAPTDATAGRCAPASVLDVLPALYIGLVGLLGLSGVFAMKLASEVGPVHSREATVVGVATAQTVQRARLYRHVIVVARDGEGRGLRFEIPRDQADEVVAGQRFTADVSAVSGKVVEVHGAPWHLVRTRWQVLLTGVFALTTGGFAITCLLLVRGRVRALGPRRYRRHLLTVGVVCLLAAGAAVAWTLAHRDPSQVSLVL